MDSSGLRALAESSEKHLLKLDEAEGITELHNLGGKSVMEVEKSDKVVNEEEKTGQKDQKSVHIIFLKDDNEDVSCVDAVDTSVEIEETSVNSDVDGKSVSDGPGGTVSHLNKIGNILGGECIEKIPVGEDEEDFDVSGEVLFQVDGKLTRGNVPRKKKKKKFLKACKACGELVERQDLLSHIKEHRRKQRELVSIRENTTNVPSMASSKTLSSGETNLAENNVSLTDSRIGNADSLPKSSRSPLLADRPFKCSVCSETFRTQSSLTIHFKSHSGECSNSCPVS